LEGGLDRCREVLRVKAADLDGNRSTPSPHLGGQVLDRVVDGDVVFIACLAAKAMGPARSASIPPRAHV
jgi:hypothetical protein